MYLFISKNTGILFDNVQYVNNYGTTTLHISLEFTTEIESWHVTKMKTPKRSRV